MYSTYLHTTYMYTSIHVHVPTTGHVHLTCQFTVFLQPSKSTAPATAMINKDIHSMTVSQCDTRLASISTDDGVEQDSLLPSQTMSKHQKKKLRKEERRVSLVKKYLFIIKKYMYGGTLKPKDGAGSKWSPTCTVYT